MRSGTVSALRFDGRDDYVDCGSAPRLKFTDSFSLTVWVKHETVGGWQCYVGDYVGGVSGYVIAQNEGRLHFHNGGTVPHVVDVASPQLIPGVWHHVAAVYDRRASRACVYLDGVQIGAEDVAGSPKPSTEHSLRFGSYHDGRESFHGELDEVRLYGRALLSREIAELYAADSRAADRQELRRMVLTSFLYPSREEAVAAVDFKNLLPLPEGASATVHLSRAGDSTPLDSKALDPAAPENEDEAAFSLAGRLPGAYEFRVVLEDGAGGTAAERVSFDHPPALIQPASPGERMAGPMSPAGAPPPDYQVAVQSGGGFTVTVKGRAYRVESSYSYPRGGENRLVAGPRDADGEPSWQVDVSSAESGGYRIRAQGRHYSIDRRIALEPTRVLVKDTIRNTSEDVVGIILSNGLNVRGVRDAQSTLLNPLTVFVHAGDGGVGLIALDDLYQLQQQRRYGDGLGELRTEHFGLDKSASYTVEWAVYPTASRDYYDFINQVRVDEGLNGGRVEGTWDSALPGELPSKQHVDLYKVRYLSLSTPWHPVDDPSLSVEGIEYMDHPQECARVREFLREAKALHPDIKVMIHVAHGLYTTNSPRKLFGDSLVIDAGDKLIDYGGGDDAYYRRYFSEERVEAGYRWYIFYPSSENSFGKAMLRAMHYMVGEMGATGMWADGFVAGYADVAGNTGGYSYDRWDGHSVDIDPQTKLVTRKKTCVSWVSLPILVESVRIVERAGGITLTNSGRNAGSRALWRENIISSCEGSREAVIALHLGRAPASLSSPAPTARASYRDILAKLDLGSLYFWYRHSMDHKTLVEHMYPITIESLYPGTIRGKERIITKESGVYGWSGDRSLHVVYLYDARGYLAPNPFFATVDAEGVRTQLDFGKDQSAAVVRLPVTLTATGPVNVNVHRYDGEEIRLALNGRGEAALRIATGEFVVQQGTVYRIEAEGVETIMAGDDAVLTVPLNLSGPLSVTISRDAQ